MTWWSALTGRAFSSTGVAGVGTCGWSAWWAVSGWAGAVVLALSMGSLAVAFGADADGNPARFASQLGVWGGFVATAAIASRVYGSGRIGADFGLRSSSDVVGRSVVVGVATQVILVPAAYVPFWLAGLSPDVSGAAESMLTDLSPAERLVVAIGVVVAAPVAEELLFRGVLLRGLAQSMSDRAAVVLSGVVFAATHFQLVQFPGLLVIGLVLAWLAVRTGGLAAPIWAHVGFNATTVVVLW